MPCLTCSFFRRSSTTALEFLKRTTWLGSVNCERIVVYTRLQT